MRNKHWDFVRPTNRMVNVNVFVCDESLPIPFSRPQKLSSSPLPFPWILHRIKKKSNRRKVSFRCAFKSTLNIKRKMRYLSSCVLKTLATEKEEIRMDRARERDWTSRLLFVVCVCVWGSFRMTRYFNEIRLECNARDQA